MFTLKTKLEHGLAKTLHCVGYANGLCTLGELTQGEHVLEDGQIHTYSIRTWCVPIQEAEEIFRNWDAPAQHRIVPHG
jgi:hypothetical protein